nr:at-rich interactive domain-containing protein 2 [Ipomoea batatas]
MVQKRPFEQEYLNEVSSKQPRHVETNDHLISLEYPYEPAYLKAHAPGKDGDISFKGKPVSDKKYECVYTDELPSFEKDREMGCPGSASHSSWATSSTSEEDVRSEGQHNTSFSPEYYNHDIPFRTVTHSKELYSYLLRNPPSKLVPVGPDFQAEIPECGGRGNKEKANCSEDACKTIDHSYESLESNCGGQFDYENRLAGTCIVPISKSESAAYSSEAVASGRSDCCCEDAGSIRCIQQHIIEAREKLKTLLGEETFVKLGFCDMGEVVAQKWTEEEQELFHDVVSSYPASLGKNFWRHLAVEFPHRTRREIVSYYFNVFMLRIRAEQNRLDPLNIDSDNDEWQEEAYDSAGEEAKMTDEDEESVVESPVHHDDPGHILIYDDYKHPYDEDAGLAIWRDYKHLGHDTNKVVSTVPEECGNKLFEKHSSELTVQHPDRSEPNEANHAELDGPSTRVDNKHWTSDYVGTGNSNGHEFVLEPRFGREWNVGYSSCTKNDVDFLPTCSMIEEVFGNEACYDKSRDGYGSS